MKFPLGDFLRSLVAPDSVLGKILGALKGSRVKLGDHDILLNEGHEGARPAKPGESRFDSTPHRPAPPPIGGRRR